MTYDPNKYHFFWSGPFSQWQKGNFEIEGVEFVTAEQAMMHHKALLFGDHETAQKILATHDAGTQKALGRQVRNFVESTWDLHKVDIVKRANHAKFSQNKGLRRKLFQTGNKVLVEASPMDTIWGIGLDEVKAREIAPEYWPGQNLLGNVLMEVRQELRSEFPDEATHVAAE
ncbi:NADAR family protein [Cognatiyoonia sp. IB215446]|uniref:NADAR family protein n=1 Tax=Cognatiyoonia sp. IB215446 TaxID=3097355 RepID=UPI002A0C77CA|nr:NADAR family protein [Cognatiyoonia sp. IB215446]MDX8350157.1 NADAR family protein [Cognatiyoonia sp. IB215446]